MMSEEDARRIEWPSSFIVRYVDGQTERLLAPDGVRMMPRADCRKDAGAISAQIQPKRPKHRSPGYRQVYFDQVEAITNEDGGSLWPKSR